MGEGGGRERAVRFQLGEDVGRHVGVIAQDPVGVAHGVARPADAVVGQLVDREPAQPLDGRQHARRCLWQRARRREAVPLDQEAPRLVPAQFDRQVRRTVTLPYTPLRMATQRDYYDILGVPRSAAEDDIKRAFRKLAQQWHPDVNTSTEADVRFKEINEAYQVLSDPQRRQAYDMFGRAGVSGGEGFDPFGGVGGAGFAGFGD